MRKFLIGAGLLAALITRAFAADPSDESQRADHTSIVCLHGTVTKTNADGVHDGFKITKLTSKEMDNVLSHFRNAPGELDSAYVGTKTSDEGKLVVVLLFGSHGCVVGMFPVPADDLQLLLQPNKGT